MPVVELDTVSTDPASKGGKSHRRMKRGAIDALHVPRVMKNQHNFRAGFREV